MKTSRCLVLGASGYIGSYLVPLLAARGYAVRAAARRIEVLEARRWASVDLCAADALDPQSLDAALEGVDVAFYLVHSMAAGKDFARRDREAAENFAAAAARAGVSRIVYLGGLQPGPAVSPHLASRRETGDILRAGSVPVTEVRAGIIVGPGSAAFEIIRDLTYHLPVMITPRWVRSRTQPIALDDLLEYLVAFAELPAAAGRILDVGGPEVLSYGELMHQFAAAVGLRRRLLIPVPVLTPRLSSYWLDLVTSVPVSVARPLIDGLRHDFVAHDDEARRLVPRSLQTYREAVRSALEREREEPLLARWTEGSLAFRGHNPQVSYYSKGETTRVTVDAPAEDTWDVVRRIGGRRGYYFADTLWSVRGLMDRLIGGVGMRRGRRHPVDLRPGDAIDFWRVAAVKPGERLTLVAEMKVPGSAVLEFEVVPLEGDRSELVTTARFHPSGAPGLLYWYALSPVHTVMFRKMPEAMARRAVRRWHRRRDAAPAAARS